MVEFEHSLQVWSYFVVGMLCYVQSKKTARTDFVYGRAAVAGTEAGMATSEVVFLA